MESLIWMAPRIYKMLSLYKDCWVGGLTKWFCSIRPTAMIVAWSLLFFFLKQLILLLDLLSLVKKYFQSRIIQMWKLERGCYNWVRVSMTACALESWVSSPSGLEKIPDSTLSRSLLAAGVLAKEIQFLNRLSGQNVLCTSRSRVWKMVGQVLRLAWLSR